MCAVLDSRRVRKYAVDGGGDVGTIGCQPDGLPWKVAVQDLHGGLRPDVLHLRDAAVATSGNYERWFDAERRYHHILDPGTGLSPSDCTRVSILAANVMLADLLATSVFVMGPDAGRAFVESRSDSTSSATEARLTATFDRGFEEAITFRMATRSLLGNRKVTWDPVKQRIV